MLAVLRPVERAIASRTRIPSWAVVMQVLGGTALIVALVGFVWDVGWHADLGRDKNLLTLPHLMILGGLLGIGGAGVAAIAMATVGEANSGWRWRGLRVPYSAAALTAFGAGAVAGFPLDDLWHRTYGIDVTMWSPTHLLMIGGASLAPLALALGAGEARWPSESGWMRARRFLLAGAVLIGLSTFQLEFDMGVPQWQALYQPVLIAAAAGIGLVAARAWLGRGGAFFAVFAFLLLRGLVSLLVGPVLGHQLPHIPTYLGAAAGVEIAFLLAGRVAPLQLALLAGLISAAIGLPVEWLWTHLWSYQPWQPRLLPMTWLPVAASAAGAVLGLAAGRAWRPAAAGLPRLAVPLAAVALVATLAVPLPRTSVNASAVLTAQPAGPPQGFAPDRSGVPTLRQEYWIEARLKPADAAASPDWFRVAAWQGGQVRDIDMVQVGPGDYRSSRPVPTGGTWKAILFLARGDVVSAAPIAMPRDADYGQPGVQPPAGGAPATRQFVPASQLLMSESHSASPLVADVAYLAFVLVCAGWLVLLIVAHRSVAAAGEPADDLLPTPAGARVRRRHLAG
ncbi:MAG TPA: hypothetical protein VF160_04155 [Candidatus Dormibacteraeota bacterium]